MAETTEGSLPPPAPNVSELLLTNLAEHQQWGLIALDNDRRVVYWNAGAESLFGVPSGKAVGQPFSSVVGGFPEAKEEQAAADAVATVGHWTGIIRYHRGDGSDLLIGYTISALRARSGSTAGSLILTRDASSRLQAEEMREQLASIVESSDDAIIGESLDGLITTWNAGAERLFGYSAREAIARPVSILLPQDRPDDLSATLGRISRGERVDHYETERVAKDGRSLRVSLTLSPIRDAAGRLTGASAIARDVTERVRLEAELRASHAQLEAILQSAADGITVQDPSGRMLYANTAAAKMIGYESVEGMLAASREETLRPLQIMLEDGTPFPIDALPGRRALRGESPPETVERCRVLATGEERYYLVQARPIFNDEGRVQAAVNSFRDITEQYRERERLRFLDEAGALLASGLDYDTTLARVAQLAVPKYADWATVDLIGEDGEVRQVALTHADPAKVSWARELSRRYPPDPNATSGSPQVIRTGEAELFVEIPREMLEAAAIDEEHLRIIDELDLTSALIVPMRAREAVLGALSLVYGGSDRHYSEADLRWAQDLADRAAMAVENARLYRDAREALHVRDEFLSTISHDLRTPLTTIRGLSQLVLRQSGRVESPAAGRMTESLRDVVRASRAMSRMIDELLDLSRIESGRPLTLNPEDVDPALLVREVVEEQRVIAPRHSFALQVTAAGAAEGWRCSWDAPRMERVLINLLSNAVKYSPDGGTITVSLGLDDGDDGHQNLVVITVRDEGIGIPATDLPKIFERYHRASNTIGHIPGLGIGLAGASQIVEQHGGSLTAESQEGHGATFTVRLPREGCPC